MLKIQMIGYVGAIKLDKPDGKPAVLSVDLASNRRCGGKDVTDWATVKFWDHWGEKLAPHIQKGDQIFVCGRPELRGFLRKDGSAGTELRVHAETMEFLGTKKNRAEDSIDDIENN